GNYPYGIILEDSTFTNICENQITGLRGISLKRSCYNNISDNILIGQGSSFNYGYLGLDLMENSSYNLITDNIFRNLRTCINSRTSNYNVIRGNILTFYYSGVGIYMHSGSYNKITTNIVSNVIPEYSNSYYI
ncbi:unnamed protein product, partial [marine sediment metagenome]